MSNIDPTARVDASAVIGEGVRIGPYCIVGPHVELGENCELIASAHVQSHTRIGPRTVVHPFAVLGGAPQSLAYRGEITRLEIGADCVIREGVTMSRGTAQDRGVTRVGDRGFFMTGCHVAHDCSVGNDAIFANCATLAGHCVLGDHVFLSGLIAVHQFSRIGSGAMIAGGAIVREDVIPFALVAGSMGRIRGVNVVGMRRRSYTSHAIRAVRRAYRLLFEEQGSLAERIERTEQELGHEPAVAEIVRFVQAARKRPLCHPRRGSAAAADE